MKIPPGRLLLSTLLVLGATGVPLGQLPTASAQGVYQSLSDLRLAAQPAASRPSVAVPNSAASLSGTGRVALPDRTGGPVGQFPGPNFQAADAQAYHGLTAVAFPAPSDHIQPVVHHGPSQLASQPVAAPEELWLTPSRWTGHVDYLSWKLNRRGLDFALLDFGPSTTLGRGVVREVDFGRDAGLRGGLFYGLPDDWQVGVVYTRFHTGGSGFAQLSPLQIAQGAQLFATRSHPSDNEEATLAIASASFKYNVYDLEAARWYVWEDASAMRLFGGLRWADVSQDFLVQYDGADYDNGWVRDTASVEGFGVHMGGELHWHIWNGVSLFGRGAGSLLLGRYAVYVEERDVAGIDSVVDLNSSFNDVLFGLDAAVGLNLRGSWWEIRTGYELDAWFNMGTRDVFPDDTHEGLYVPNANDILLEGLFLQCVLKH